MRLNCDGLSNVNQILYISSKHTNESLQTLSYRTAYETHSLYQKQVTISRWQEAVDFLYWTWTLNLIYNIQ